ncbi:30S ribosomal protein S21, chloroplastic-like [Rhodamnia argentea]|uniref:30S ribosomal protein S21, chloroplastic-like n=1 Tax=Rhodamnia argentea TaxID=178133 RepID=A0A8B8P9E4_9MYRT|nr:30S ribosomal protein S21, chloroplastic-like [Rhodamnia argentea]
MHYRQIKQRPSNSEKRTTLSTRPMTMMFASSLIADFLPSLFPSKSTPTSSSSSSTVTWLRLPSQPTDAHQKWAALAADVGPLPSPSLSSSTMSTVCPSLVYANTLFFKSTYNVQITVDDNESEERLVNRFRREVAKAGIIRECRRRRFFETKQEYKKRKSREAAKRNRRRRPQARIAKQAKPEMPKKKRANDDEDDNWDLPQGVLPY